MDYKTSRDYEKAIALIEEGAELVCFVDYAPTRSHDKEIPIRDVAIAKKKHCSPFEIRVGVRGIEYLGTFGESAEENKRQLLKQLQQYNVEFIFP